MEEELNDWVLILLLMEVELGRLWALLGVDFWDGLGLLVVSWLSCCRLAMDMDRIRLFIDTVCMGFLDSLIRAR